MLELFHSTLITPTALKAIVLPVLFMSFWAIRGLRHSFTDLMLAAFVISTAESVFLSRWWDSPNELSLHIFPACALLLIMLPREKRPHWKVAYCLIFFSQLTADLVCALRYALEQDCVSAEFFCAVGGAGFKDALFVVPTFVAFCLWCFELVESKGLGHWKLFHWPTRQSALSL